MHRNPTSLVRTISALAMVTACMACPGPGEPPTANEVLDAVSVFEDNPGNLVRAHAHNDYYQERPLFDALDRRFYSVEADVFVSSDELSVAHYAWEYYGSLTQLYLEPLAILVRERGSVYGDGVPFTLWVDIKSTDESTLARLDDALNPYEDVLSTFEDDEVISRPITVVLTGDEDLKTAYANREGRRLACRDSNDFAVDDPDADERWRYYALSFDRYVEWADDAPTAQEQFELNTLVEDIRDTNRPLRFFGTPDTEAVWQALYDSGADFINTDSLDGLKSFLTKEASGN